MSIRTYAGTTAGTQLWARLFGRAHAHDRSCVHWSWCACVAVRALVVIWDQHCLGALASLQVAPMATGRLWLSSGALRLNRSRSAWPCT